ncbi:MAG: TolC family protein [Arenicella sp.]|nr:TolC family protein [Arenicella sp.]
MKNKSYIEQPKVALLFSCAAFFLASLPSSNVFAGSLLDSYNSLASKEYQSEGPSALNSKSLEAKVRVQRSKMGPSLTLSAAEVRRKQDISATGNSLIRSGQATFDNSRRMATLKQPLFDPQIRGELALAKLEYKGSLQVTEQDEQKQIADYFVSYVEASLLQNIVASYQRALDRLKKEQAAAQEKRNLKLVTVHELDTIKLHTLRLAKLSRLSLSQYQQTLNYLESFNLSTQPIDMMFMRQDLDSSENFKLNMTENAIISDVEANKISNQIAQLDQTIKNVKSNRWPTVNAIGLYEYDDAAETIFGGQNTVSNYEVGITFVWELFSGGGTKYKVREANYAKKSRQALLEKRNQDNRVHLARMQNSYSQSFQHMKDERSIMSHSKSIKEAIEKGYQAGTESLLSKIDSIRLHEESIREYEMARHNALIGYIKLKSFTDGIFEQDARHIDALFN